MDYEAYVISCGLDPATMTLAQKAMTQAAYRATHGTPAPTPPTLPVARHVDPPAPTPPTPTQPQSFTDKMNAIEAEAARQETIRTATMRVSEMHRGNPDKLKQLRELCDSACADEKMDVRAFELALLRMGRFDGPMVFAPSTPEMNSDVVEAAICISHRLPGVESQFSERTLEAANKHFKRGLRLRKLMYMGAKANGFRGDDSDYSAVCRSIMRGGEEFSPMAGGVGPSTGIQVPGILSNTGNKFLVASFMNVEQAWRRVAKISPVGDFKQTTKYRMSGDNTFLRVAPSGEIKHGALSETSYTNQAKTFGRLLGISREDYINDDLGAFVSVNQELGRGGADAINNVFYTVWLDDSTFFPTDKSLLNYDDGATDSVLSLAGLDNAEAIFAVQTKPDGTPLGATPKILFVPSALKNTGLNLMANAPLVVGTTPASGPGTNVFAGRYEVVSSAFLHRTSLKDENGVSQTVTGSSTAWYMLCDPDDIACIEVVFVDGRDTPFIETDWFQFDHLGLATRAYFDFGVRKQEYRGGLKLKGAA